jgi:POT family proton-dependent oligopeptide transporter
MFENQPKALYALALANTGERFGYYTMLAVFALFLRANFGLEAGTAGLIYSIFLGLVYFLPLIGGFMADKFGYGKMVTIGIAIMFVGYLFLSIPLGGGSIAFIAMLAALLLISFGTGLFKGNLQVMVGNLYDTPELAGKRDSAFSIFYMAINIGALFAPTAAVKIQSWAEATLHCSSNDAYHFSFAVACVSLIVSMAIYYGCRRMFKHVEGGNGKTEKKDTTVAEEQLTPQQTKERIVALCLVFAVVIFFWMAFHQNGLTLTYFANEFVSPVSTGVQSMAFDVVNLVMIVLMVYSGMTFFQSKTAKAKAISGVVFLVAVLVLMWKYRELSGSVEVSAPIFQQFNPFYVVALTPVSMAIFSSLAAKGKEPSAPRKIAYGMIVAGCAYFLMVMASQGLLTPNEQAAAKAAGAHPTFASANWLIGTYLVLTFGELLLSPMGISFVSKVAPPKYKGAMMGGWFVATAIGNLLVSVGGYLWGGLSLTIVWSVFIVLCLISAAFMFLMMKRLEKVA